MSEANGEWECVKCGLENDSSVGVRTCEHCGYLPDYATAQTELTRLRNLLDALALSPESGAESVTAAQLLERQQVEIERLTKCLKGANSQAEEFERKWYLRGDELERLATENEGMKAEVERLREEARMHDTSEVERQFNTHLAGCLIFEDELKQLGMSEDDGKWINTRAETAERELSEARAALKPFADAATDFNPGRSDDEVIARISHAGTAKYVITLGDLRKAANVCGVGSGTRSRHGDLPESGSEDEPERAAEVS